MESTEVERKKSRARYDKARADNALELSADYVELIHDLIEEFSEARATDLAVRMGVSHVTVSKTLQRLVRDGYVTYRPYRSVFLTDKGKALATESKARHETALSFLLWLGVPPEVAAQDAEGIEHHLSQETLAALRLKLHEAGQTGTERSL